MTIQNDDREFGRPYKGHPLKPLVLALFAEHGAFDIASLAQALGAPAGPPRGPRAYMVVAEDMIGMLRGEGLIFRDHGGWYRLVVKAKA